MPHMSRKVAAGLNIPTGGTWFETQEHALAEIATDGGFMVEVQLRTPRVSSERALFGVYTSQAVFCRNATRPSARRTGTSYVKQFAFRL